MVTIGKTSTPLIITRLCVPSPRRLSDAFWLPFRLAKKLLEDVWVSLKLLSSVAYMSLGALGPLLGCSWLALASLLLPFELVLLA